MSLYFQQIFHNRPISCNNNNTPQTNHLLELLLGAKLIGMSALLLSAILSTGWKSSETLTANSLLAIEPLGNKGKSRIINSSTKTENQMKSRLLLDIVIGKSTAILELLSSENKTLLIRGDSLLVLDLGLYVIDGVTWLDIEGDGLPGEGLYEDLHCI